MPRSSKLTVTTLNLVGNTIYPSTAIAKLTDCFPNRSIDFSVIRYCLFENMDFYEKVFRIRSVLLIFFVSFRDQKFRLI